MGDGLGINDGLDVGIGVVGDSVGDTEGARDGSQESHVSCIQSSLGVIPYVDTSQKDRPVGGMLINSPASSS